ncbi:MAG: DNA-binding response regulator [Bacteroidetes bacterium]|nr:MAG: DNA-binding response regulator [Bacteroidota bacterium]
MKIQCAIVDDEPLALDVLENYIEKIEQLELVARVDNAVEAFNLLSRQQIDLLFLDIQMPKLTGLELLKNITHPPRVIFTTAYREYALEGYELNVVDYLLKPISFERFLKAVNKVFQLHGLHAPSVPAVAQGSSTEQALYTEAFIYLKADKKMVKVLLDDILYIESLKDYIRVKTPHKSVTAYQRISHMEEKLPDDRFMRIHRSYIISKRKVEAYSTSHVEIANVEIPIGRNYRAAVLKALNRDNLLRE